MLRRRRISRKRIARLRPDGLLAVAWLQQGRGRLAASRREEQLYLSVLTLGRYDKGTANVAPDDLARLRYAAIRDALANRFARRIPSVFDAIVLRSGMISGTVKRETGHAPPVIDTLLAATAIEHDLCLVTQNVRDVAASGAVVINPWETAG